MEPVSDKAPAVVLNMEFRGNPGTTNDTVARIMAGSLYQTGILSKSEIIEVGRSDLVAEYIGQTAEKAKSVFQNAKGKMIFMKKSLF